MYSEGPTAIVDQNTISAPLRVNTLTTSGKYISKQIIIPIFPKSRENTGNSSPEVIFNSLISVAVR